MSDKASFRLAMKERLSRLRENDRRVESQILVRELKKFVQPMSPRSIGVYIPFQDEPDIRSLIEEWTTQGLDVSIPQAEEHGMRFHRIKSIGHTTRDAANIPAPVDPDPIDEASLDLVLIPGRAFTKEGWRMGRGNGGYDRWISEQRKRNPSTKFIGICFDCQVVQEMPVDPHDERVDAVFAPSKIHNFSLPESKNPM